MCECLSHPDGTITLCEVCSDTWREYETVIIPKIAGLESVFAAVLSALAWEDKQTFEALREAARAYLANRVCPTCKRPLTPE